VILFVGGDQTHGETKSEGKNLQIEDDTENEYEGMPIKMSMLSSNYVCL
jgi:hypothetical protein